MRLFVISGCQPAGAFQLVDASLDAVAQCVDEAVSFDRLLAVLFARNDRRSAPFSHVVADAVAVIAPVGDGEFAWWQVCIGKQVITFVVRDFSAGDFGAHRQAVPVGDQMNLGRKATF